LENWDSPECIIRRLRFEYENNHIFAKEFNFPAVDIVESTFDRPFYSSPVFGNNALNTRPVSHIWYTSQGYGELLNPNNPSGVQTNNKPDSFSMWDQPGGGASFRLPDFSAVKRVEKIIAFQTWLVAIKTGLFSSSPELSHVRDAFFPKLFRESPSSVSMLAHIPPFSLMFWLETDLAHFQPKNSFDTPSFSWGVYGINGYIPGRRIDRSIRELGPSRTIRPKLGDGGRWPVLSGPTAKERADQFLSSNGLRR
jgi:hypothetical protein